MPRRRWTWLHLAGAVVAVASLVLCVLFVRRSASQLPAIDWDASSFGALMVATGLYLLSLTLLGIGWHLLLDTGADRSRLPWSNVVAIFLGTQIGKYVPGNVAQYAGRFELLRRLGVEGSVVATTMLLEALGLVAVAFAVTASAAALSGQELLAEIVVELPAKRLVLLLLFLIAVLATLTLVKRRVGGGEASSSRWQRIHPPRLFVCLVLYAAFFVLNGIGLAGLASGLFGIDSPSLPVLIGVFAAAWAVGFLAVGAPAGMGVRDFLMLATLSALWDPGVAVGVTVAHRLVTAVGDGVSLPLAWLAARRSIAADR